MSGTAYLPGNVFGPAHAWRLGTRRNPGNPGGQQPQTYFRAECTECVSHGRWRVDPAAAQQDYARHAAGRPWPVRRVAP
jgi:hypothetical protein